MARPPRQEATQPEFSGFGRYAGPATLILSSLTPGSHIIFAIYQGDAVNLTSTSPTIEQIVEENTSMTLTASSNPVPYGVFVTLTASVTPGSSGVPTGVGEGSVTGESTIGLLLSIILVYVLFSERHLAAHNPVKRACPGRPDP